MDRRLIIIKCSVLLLAIVVESVPDFKPCSGNQFQPHETDCSLFYICDHGGLQLMHCPAGLFWNNDHCDWPANTICHHDYSPIATAITYQPSSGASNVLARTRDGLKVVCYFTDWSGYRDGPGKFSPEDIDGDLCTHIIYAFAVLDVNSLTIKPADTWADVDSGFYKKVLSYKSKGVKVLIGLGGGQDSAGNKYSRLVNDGAARARFIANVAQFIGKWGFDGLDLDWEFPKCWSSDCTQGPDSDKPAFGQFVKELHDAFAPRGWLLSAAVSANPMVIDYGYDVPTLTRYLDWISVMNYDYHGQWDHKTGHIAPLYSYPGDTSQTFNTDYGLKYWIQLGADPKKLVMGMPQYGISFTLADPNDHGLNAKSFSPGFPGDSTKSAGTLAFFEICAKVKRESWNVVRDPQGRIGPYAYKGNQWVSYDDIAEFQRKSQYVKANGLGGGMIWALGFDDFHNTCGCGRSPLLRMMNHELRGVPLESNLQNCT